MKRLIIIFVLALTGLALTGCVSCTHSMMEFRTETVGIAREVVHMDCVGDTLGVYHADYVASDSAAGVKFIDTRTGEWVYLSGGIVVMNEYHPHRK